MADFRTTSYRFGTHKGAAVALLLSAVSAGCTAPGNPGYGSKHEPTYLRLTEERAFAQTLRQRYLELASNAFDRGDHRRSDFYSLRSLMAVEGKLAQPVRPERTRLTWGSWEEAATAYNRLEAVLESGVRVGAPELAARAQAAFDCWMLEGSAGGNATIAQSCRYNALEALGRLEAASVGARITQAGGPQYATPEYVPPQQVPAMQQGYAVQQMPAAHQGYAVQQVPAVQPGYVAAPQTFVVDSTTPSQTFHAHGMTIEVIHQQAAPQTSYVTRRVPASTSRVAAPRSVRVSRAAVPVRVESAPVRYTAPAPVRYSEPAPIQHRTEQTYIAYDEREGFDQVPVITAADAVMLSERINIAPEMMRPSVPVVNLGPVDTIMHSSNYVREAIPMVSISETAIRSNGTAEALVAAQAAQQSDFSIYFGFDSAEVTLEAEDVLVDTVERIKLSGARHVTLTGFTDSVGDARYNQLLAMRRAQAVRKYLQQAVGGGVKFELLPVGEAVAVRDGGDGVKEALNRRVEVSIQ